MTKTDPQIERDRIRALRWQFKRLPTKARLKRCRPKKETDGMTSAERTRNWRRRVDTGRRVYTAELDGESTEQLLRSFDCETFEQLLERLNMVDGLLVTRHGHGLSPVLLWLIEQMTKDET